jgi:alpha-N-arabinofuranosidase
MFDTDGGWTHAPHMLEELYNLEDALVVAGFLNSFVRHADVVRIANLAQVANVIAPVLTRGDELLVQSIFHPFAMFSQRRAGTSLRVAVDGPTYGTLAHGDVAVIDASCILGADELHLFLVNRSTDSAAPIQLDVPGHVLSGAVRAELLTGERADAGNTWESPDVLVPVALSDQVVVDGGSARVELPPLSFAAISLGR